MKTTSPHLAAQAPEMLFRSSLGQSNTSDSSAQNSEISSCATVTTTIMDPHGLAVAAPLAFAAHVVAIDCYTKLLNRSVDDEVVIQRLQKLAPRSAFQLDFVGRQILKFIKPRGHGANSSRFTNETLGWFRQTYPADAHLTAGLILIICAARWWIHEQGSRSIIPRTNPLTTSDLDSKLKSFGFLKGERKAICRMLRRNPNHR